MWAALRRITIDQWRTIHEESLDRGRPGEPPPLHMWPLAVMLIAAVILTAQDVWGDRDTFGEIWRRPANRAWLDSTYELTSFAWWTAWRVGGYFVVPALIVAFTPGQRLADYGFSLKGFSKHAWLYVVLFLAILPVVIIASRTDAFRETYPFYKLANRSRSDLLAWEAMYALQFFALEFFFRGFLLQGLRRAVGAHAIWIMVVPYTMIHFQKPVAETLGAVVAGLVLGTLALRTRSIWCGVLIHISVALTMDLLALQQCPADSPCPAHGDAIWEKMKYGR